MPGKKAHSSVQSITVHIAVLWCRRITANQYRVILTNHLYLMMNFLSLLEVVSSRVTMSPSTEHKGLLDKYEHDVNYMFWPSQSPDHNQIKSHKDRCVRQLSVAPSSKPQLREIVGYKRTMEAVDIQNSWWCDCDSCCQNINFISRGSKVLWVQMSSFS